MTESFRASFLKIDRARRHLKELEALVTAYLSSEPVKIDMKIEGGRVAINMKSDPLPDEASAIAGDIFHNLRSSLDLMAAELCGTPGSPALDARFPFCAEKGELDRMIKARSFDRAGDAAVKLLKEWQPYKGGNTALRAVHDLNIRDKHRMLIIHPISFSSPVIDLRPPQGGMAIVGDPTKAGEIQLSFPSDCALAGRDLVPTMHELVDLTASIIESFKSLAAQAE